MNTHVPVFRIARRLQAGLIALTCAFAGAPAAGAPMTVDYSISTREHIRLHHGQYISLWVDETPYPISVSFDDTVASVLEAQSQSRTYEIGAPGTTVDQPFFTVQEGTVHSSTRVTQDWSGAELLTTFTQEVVFDALPSGEIQGHRSYFLSLQFRSPWEAPPLLTSESLRQYFTEQVGSPVEVGSFSHRTWGGYEDYLMWDESFSGAVVKVIGVHAVPEPGTVALCLGGLSLLVAVRRRRLGRAS
ncbi:PEP-CTERM sorting domain-containing protein [Aquabacterium sp. A7-Y]|uniref:PEP-CTERM sorting domain-containing protein n=1 Tax=Aquabacterium sp. A7-Y TaxID=1349605 RepID=UPI00223DD13A|nr:PEP-CTERM sorting domain-containing protein [Aquabacterium sp. A7-Y]MCW7540137.1 PEP-CTERM sorting domain-containing protein [Aquabacterium sp. A7-Y]